MPSVADREAPALEVADSFLVLEGAVTGLHLHRRRFLRTSGFTRQHWDAVLGEIPRTGAWFPRIEKRAGAQAPNLLLRPAPPQSSTAVVQSATRDPRRDPSVKGPDLERLRRLRDEARAHGADEAVILNSGYVVEGAGSSLVWWRAATLNVVGPEFTRMPSVTENLIRSLATEDHVRVVNARATPADLDGAEVWALSALHGVRAVTAWLDGPRLAVPDAGRLMAWRERWSRLARPMGCEDHV